MSLIKKAALYSYKIPKAARIELRTLSVILRYGLPDVMLQMLGGFGDELLLTTVAHELKKRNKNLRVWQVSFAADILRENPDYEIVLNWAYWELRFSHILDRRRCFLSYSEQMIPGELEKPPDNHILTEMCKQAGIKGEIALRPYIHLEESEKILGRLSPKQITIHCAGENSHGNIMRNKLWGEDNFRKVVQVIKTEFNQGDDLKIIQVGVLKDPPISGCIDLRGKSLRETAAIIQQSDAFIGTSGFLSHMARAVDCRAVIIYGGREHSHQTGYVCNENLDSFLDCAPCWQWNRCDYDRKCMKMIKPKDVVRALKKILQKRGKPLETQKVQI